MNSLPSDPELQRMSNDKLRQLWGQRPKYSENADWIRVAKEIRHRKRFNQWEYRR